MDRLANFLKKQIAATLLAIFFGFLVVAIILVFTGYNPVKAFGVLFNGIFSKPKYISQVIIKATPIILTGISVAFAFKVGLFNIGVEGQYIIGTVAATIAGIIFDFPPIIQPIVIILCGIMAGALYGVVIGYLKAKFGIHEVITSIMLNWIAFYFGNFIVNTTYFHQPNSTGTYAIKEKGYTMILYAWKQSKEGKAYLKQHPQLMDFILKTDINIGIIVAIVVAIVVAILLKNTTKGYELRSVGLNRYAAEFAGINVNKNICHAMLIAGALAGLAGALTITGMAPHKISTMGTFENYGFNGMSVALIAGSSPIGCIFAGLLFAGLLYGGGSLQSAMGIPSEIINIMIGTIVFFIALTTFIPVLVDKIQKKGEKNAR